VGRPHHGNRHGRSAEAQAAVLRAADGLLVERGYAGVTVGAIAARAGVAKQTIYRWWQNKNDVLLDAFLQDAAETLEPEDLGDLGGDLRGHLQRLAAFLTTTDAGAVFRALLAEAQHDPHLRSRLRQRFLDEQRRRDMRPIERAIARGDIPADLDLAFETDQLIGPVYHRVLVTGEPVDAAFTDRVVAAFLARQATRPDTRVSRFG
jgi:AcrR family transcriptional regulator